MIFLSLKHLTVINVHFLVKYQFRNIWFPHECGRCQFLELTSQLILVKIKRSRNRRTLWQNVVVVCVFEGNPATTGIPNIWHGHFWNRLFCNVFPTIFPRKHFVNIVNKSIPIYDHCYLSRGLTWRFINIKFTKKWVKKRHS